MWSKPRRAKALAVAGTKQMASVAARSARGAPSGARRAAASSSEVAIAAAMTGASLSSCASLRAQATRRATPPAPAKSSAQTVARDSHAPSHSVQVSHPKGAPQTGQAKRWSTQGRDARHSSHRSSPGWSQPAQRVGHRSSSAASASAPANPRGPAPPPAAKAWSMDAHLPALGRPRSG